jgi:hypothetical protein
VEPLAGDAIAATPSLAAAGRAVRADRCGHRGHGVRGDAGPAARPADLGHAAGRVDHPGATAAAGDDRIVVDASAAVDDLPDADRDLPERLTSADAYAEPDAYGHGDAEAEPDAGVDPDPSAQPDPDAAHAADRAAADPGP